MDAGTRNVYNSKHPVAKMEDLQGLKIRTMGNQMFVDMTNAMGANGVAMGYDQLINALQTGIVDGAENNYPSYSTGQHYNYAQVLLDDRPSDDPGDPGLLQEGLGFAFPRGSGARREARQGSAA